MSGPSYRCDACAHRTARCAGCRAARAAARRDLRARKITERVCVDCDQPAEPAIQRCARCEARMLAMSRVAHAAARERGDE